jgi:hypothetical protein
LQQAGAGFRVISLDALSCSGRERFVALGTVKKRHRLETVIARAALPEVRDTGGAGLDPFRHGDRSAALGARILTGHRDGTVDYCHGASPFPLSGPQLDSVAVGYRGLFLRTGLLKRVCVF